MPHSGVSPKINHFVTAEEAAADINDSIKRNAFKIALNSNRGFATFGRSHILCIILFDAIGQRHLPHRSRKTGRSDNRRVETRRRPTDHSRNARNGPDPSYDPRQRLRLCRAARQLPRYRLPKPMIIGTSPKDALQLSWRSFKGQSTPVLTSY